MQEHSIPVLEYFGRLMEGKGGFAIFLRLIDSHSSALTPSSLPCNKWNAPALWMPGRNQIGWERISLSIRVMSHATSLPESSVELEDPPEVADPSEESDSSL